MSSFTELKIRPSYPADFAELAHVWEASVAATHHFLRREDFLLLRGMIVEFFEQVDLVHATGADGRITGFLGTSDDKVEMLFIHPDERGHGIGKGLLRYAIEQLGIRKVDVNEQNEQAVGFYQRMGFQVIGRSAVDGMGKPYPLLCLALPDE